MADLDTVHKITEKIEFQGAAAAFAAFDKLSNVVAKVAKLMEAVSDGGPKVEDFEELGEKAEEAGEDAAKGGKKGESAWLDFAKGMTVANLAAKASEWALNAVKGAISGLFNKLWGLNDELDDSIDKLTAFSSVYTKFQSDVSTDERIEKAGQIAGAVYAEYKEIAFGLGETTKDIKMLGEDLLPMALSAGKSWKFTTDMVKNAAYAAKALQADTGQAGASIERLLFTATPGRARDPFTLMLASEAKLKKSDTAEQRIDKLNRALEKMGKGAGAFTSGWNEAAARFGILTDDLFQRSGSFLYDKAGDALQRVVDLLEGVKGPAGEVADEVARWGNMAYDFALSLGGGIYYALKGVGVFARIGDSLEIAWDAARGFGDAFEFVVLSAKAIEESVKLLAGDSQGVGKLETIADAMYAKMLRFVEKFGDGIIKLLRLADKLTGESTFTGLGWAANEQEKSMRAFKSYIATVEKDVDAREQKYGLGRSTEVGREAERKMDGLRMTKDERDKLLKGMFGDKRPLIEIDTVNINQDFRDQDPDGIVIDTVRALESLSEAAKSSGVGGPATAFGP